MRSRGLSQIDPLLGQVRQTYVRLPIYPKTHYVMSQTTKEQRDGVHPRRTGASGVRNWSIRAS